MTINTNTSIDLDEMEELDDELDIKENQEVKLEASNVEAVINEVQTERIVNELANQEEVNENKVVQNILDTSTFLILRFKSLNISKTIPKDKIQTDAHEKYVKGSKKIIQSEEYDAIKSFDNETRATIKEMTLESFHPSIYIVPEESIVKIERYLLARSDGRKSLVRILVEAYPELLSKASLPKEEGGLGELFDEKDYVSVDEIEDFFAIEWQFVTFNVAQSLKKIDDKMYEEAKRKAEVKATNLLNKLRNDIKKQFLKLMSDMIDKLKGTYDGKQKRLGERFINNIHEFIDEYESKQSVLQDSEFSNIVSNFKASLKSTESILETRNVQRKLEGKEQLTLSELIKSDGETKDFINDVFSNAKSLIEENMANNYDRSINLTDDLI